MQAGPPANFNSQCLSKIYISITNVVQIVKLHLKQLVHKNNAQKGKKAQKVANYDVTKFWAN